MRLICLLTGLLISCSGWAVSARDYLPPDADLNPDIPTPESILDWEVGDWRISHDQLVTYMYAIADSSDRVSIKVIGRTHEQRPLLQLVFTSPGNQARLEELRQRHLQAAFGDRSDDAPLVVWLGHSIHGNEASGSNAAPLVAYYLAASRSEFVTGLLANSIVLLDPSFNPDGLQRFSSWSNSNRSLNPVSDRNHRIHNEEWPQARTNHYLFDLNRDWLPLVHPESRARITEFHRWLPHVLTDQHESRYDSYFFQPGVPSRQNPSTPPENLELTAALAQYHAQAMDAAGQAYFTEDTYDDFYFGKGSSYPDINGSIGILFEQAGVKGPVRDSDHGPLKFTDAIGNHLRTSISTLRGASELRGRLADYQRGFFATMGQRAANAGFRAWVMGDDGDPARAAALLRVFDQHQVDYRPLAEEVRSGGRVFRPGHAWVFPVRQRQYGMLQTMMESRTEFADNTFYDVSAWTQPLAYNLPHAQLQRVPRTGPDVETAASMPNAGAVAWIVSWQQMGAAELLQNLLDANVRVFAATRPFTVRAQQGDTAYSAGALVIHRAGQDDVPEGKVYELLSEATRQGLVVASTSSGLTPEGPELGSFRFKRIKPVKPLLVAGEGVSSYEVGETWHLLDQRLGIAPVMVDSYRLKNISLSDYTHMILVDGQYDGIGKTQMQAIARWVNDGGIMIVTGRAAEWSRTLCFDGEAEKCAVEKEDETKVAREPRAYGDFSEDDAKRVVGGAIVSSSIDLTHPIAYGYSRPDLPLFRRGVVLLESSENAYATPVRYTDEPLLSGFIGERRLDEIRGEAAVIAERKGGGLLVQFANDPLFRGFWRGTEKLFINSLYMGQIVEKTDLPD